jgi:hypothetical protein
MQGRFASRPIFLRCATGVPPVLGHGQDGHGTSGAGLANIPLAPHIGLPPNPWMALLDFRFSAISCVFINILGSDR